MPAGVRDGKAVCESRLDVARSTTLTDGVPETPTLVGTENLGYLLTVMLL